jgi:hypothetical protein
MDAGLTDDFSLGLTLIRNGLDLTLKSDGNILILGPLVAVGTIDLIAGGTIEFGFGSGGDLGGDTDIFFGGGDVTIGAGFRAGPTAMMISGSTEQLALFQTTRIVAAVTGVVPIFPKPEPTSGVFVYREGDIYIDVSLFEFENFRVIAGESIVIFTSDSTPVPEPGTALLFGFGLTMLAARRPKNGILD